MQQAPQNIQQPPVLLSIVVPMHNEAQAIDSFFSRIIPILESITTHWEILAVDDGSVDQTLAQLRQFHAKEPRIRVIALSRNFGKEAALSAGLNYTRGNAVIPIDADLQDPPELIPQMVEQWRAGFLVVLAKRVNRSSDSWPKRTGANLFYRVLSAVSNIEIPQQVGDFRLMDAQVVAAMRALPERTRFMKGLFAWVGFKTTTVTFERPQRQSGQAQQRFWKLWNLAKDGIFSFTTMPLRWMTQLGMTISLLTFIYALFLLTRVLIFGVDVPGYASLMIVVLGIGGIQLVCIGVLGEYIGRIFQESKQRPLYIISEALGFE